MFTFFISAFVLGIISNMHCIGMCGPIALAIPLNRSSKLEMTIGILQYNFGRIFTYSILGLIIGVIGFGINLIGILQIITIVSGVTIVIYAWRKKLFKRDLFPFMNMNSLHKFTSKNMGKILTKNSPAKLFLLGMLNGLLPCGMVYTALITSLTVGNPIYSSFTLFFFGLGTLPGMVLISVFANKITSRFRSKINKVLPYLITLIGIFIILRGMNINIPFLNHKINYNEKINQPQIKDCPIPIALNKLI